MVILDLDNVISVTLVNKCEDCVYDMDFISDYQSLTHCWCYKKLTRKVSKLTFSRPIHLTKSDHLLNKN